ncbi:hypothetical protein [Paenibacillus sp. 1001270B_150601_E10]|uniref:hypothetical protein n=1 Tax=Paenibacillus sp. 1001270B_150601_E10 TaxID=2787079 RepID=UPI001E3953BA|nr:hypothetical protein [Paenibacillus sp. 1001270B_150601_E10]
MSVPSSELIYHPFKLEISTMQKSEWLKKASLVDDSWAIKVGSILHITSLFDPHHIFDQGKEMALSVSDEAIKKVVEEFMVWEPYETMGKKVINGELSDNEELYRLCENLWTGLNELLEDLGIDYRSNNVLKL